MSAPSSHNNTMTEFERMLNDPDFRRMSNLPLNETTGPASESPPSTVTTPGLLDSTFFYETNVDERNSENSSPAPRSQTTREASSAVHGLTNSVVERGQGSAKTTVASTGTMTRTPIKMVSIGTMPQTPIRLITTTTSYSRLDNETIDLCSPQTPTNSPQ